MAQRSWPGTLGAFWGIAGVLTLLVFATWRLAGTSLDAFGFDWDWRHWTVLSANLIFMAYAEGYKGFQKSYAPRVVARAGYLLTRWTPLRVLVAPLFCMGFFHATRRRLVSAWLLTVMIVLLITLFRQLPQPWRGILDAGVVVGLSWGALSIALFAAQLLRVGQVDAAPEVPEAGADLRWHES